MKALRCLHVECGSILMACSSSSLDPLWAGAFNAVGGCYIPPHQDALMMGYATAEPRHVSVLRVKVHDCWAFLTSLPKVDLVF
jgi:hypothetical protein